MQITGTHFNYYLICHRKLWLFANGINMESTSDLVYEGKIIHENSYSRRSSNFQEIELAGIKIDYFDKINKVVHEIKKSDSHEEAHEWQLKYYLFVLKQNGVLATGILEYPKLHKTQEVVLTTIDHSFISEKIEIIEIIIKSQFCPEKINKTRCKNCSYYEFCWSGED